MDEENELEELAPWLVILVTLIGGGLRILLLDQKGLWLDETLSVWVSSHSVVDMLPWIARVDQHPPLYYLLLHTWMALKGDTPNNVRLLSALFGAGTIPVIFLIGRRMMGAAVGLAAAVFLAVSPFHIRFAQEARMFTLLTFNAAVAIYALVRLFTDSRSARPIGSQFREYIHAWRTPVPVDPDAEGEFSYKVKTRSQTGWRAWISRHRWLPIQTLETDLTWLAFILFSAATLLSHNSAVLFSLAANIFVLGLMLYQKGKGPGSPPAFQAPSLGNWVKAQIGIFLLWSPWLFPFIQQAGRVYQEFWIPAPGWETVIQALRSFLNESISAQAAQYRVVWMLYALVLGLGLVHTLKKASRFFFLAALFGIPFLGELVVSIYRPVFLDRTLIWTTIPLFLVLAAGIAQLRFRFLMIGMLGIFGTINLFSTSDYFRFTYKEDWSNPAGYVANFVQPGDLILFNTPKVQIPFDYYFIPYEKQYFLQVEKHGVPVDLFDSGVLEPRMTERDIPGLVSLLDGHTRVWLVYGQPWNTDPMGLIPKTLGSEMKLMEKRDYYGAQVLFYETP